MSSKNQKLNLLWPGSGYLGPSFEGPSDANTLAKILFDKYDKDRGGKLGQAEVAQIMIEMYRSMNRAFTPTKADIDQFSKILDANKDGHVDQYDVERVSGKTMTVDAGWEVKRQTFVGGNPRVSMMVNSSMLNLK